MLKAKLISGRDVFVRLAHRIVNRGIIVVSKFSDNVYCPICNWNGWSFIYFGSRKNARCPKCGSCERHRLQRLVMDQIRILEIIKGEKVLHFAPENFFEEVFEGVSDLYISADIQPGKAGVVVDIRHIPFKNGTFRLVYASHVLEHLQDGDDVIAIQEVYRVLQLGGIAILPIPVHRKGKTIEYGFSKKEDSGHFRSPGTNYFKKFKEIGFSLRVFSSWDFNCKTMGLMVTKPGFGVFPDYVPVLTKLKRDSQKRLRERSV